MFLERIDNPAAALAEVSRTLSATFDQAVESIGVVRTSAGELASSVSLLQALGTSEGEQADDQTAFFDVFSAHAAAAAAAARDAAAGLEDSSFLAGLHALSMILADLKRHTIELAAVSSLIKIAKAEDLAVAEGLHVFTEMLDRRCSDLRASTAKASELIESIRAESVDARFALEGIVAELRRIASDASDGASRLGTLRRAHLQHMEVTAAESRTLGEQVQAAVGRVISCLQFPDALAQRIEHVQAMLAALDEERPLAERRAITMLAAAQLDAMAIALTDAADDAVAALGAIPVGRGAPASGEADPSAVWLAAESRANAMMIAAVAVSHNRLDVAVDLIGHIVSQIDAVRSLLDTSKRHNEDLNISVHNASITASQFSSGCSPLHVLADSVRTVVGKISRSVARISEQLASIRRASQTLQHSPLLSELDFLSQTQERAASRSNEDEVRLARSREASESFQRASCRLGKGASTGRQHFERARDQATTLLVIASQLRGSLPEETVIPTDNALAWIEALYTMNEERDVHANLFGTVSSAPTLEGSEELDDFIF